MLGRRSESCMYINLALKPVLWIWIHWIKIRIWIRIQVFNTKNWKNIQLKICSNLFFWSKMAIYLSLGLHKERPSYMRCLQPSREHSAIQKMKFINYFCVCGSFLPSWIRIANPDPDPGTPIRIRIHNTVYNIELRYQGTHLLELAPRPSWSVQLWAFL
jgi:hypothetical protein